MEWELEIRDSEFVPQKRKPTEEKYTTCRQNMGSLDFTGFSLYLV